MSARSAWQSIHRGARCVAQRMGRDFEPMDAPTADIGRHRATFRLGAARDNRGGWAGEDLRDQEDVRRSGSAYTLWRFRVGTFPRHRPVLP